ncbi:MAG: 3'-5' exonuclease [Planctomycetes bacterium]|nr:3'-5' exonuclease [Planctomycetota bacterium]
MILKLTRPLVFLDFETTGLDTQKDRIMELAFVRLLPDGTRETLHQRVRPDHPVSKQSTAVTGIHDQDANSIFWGPQLKKVGQRLVEFLGDSDLGGFNQIDYDVPLWLAECKRNGIAFDLKGRHQIDAKVIFNVKETGWDRFLMGPRNLSAACRLYLRGDLESSALDGAHSAEKDVQATIDVLLAQLQRYTDLPREVPALAEWCARNSARNRDDDPAMVAAGGAGA